MSPQSTIAHYRIVSKLGEGGMGAVYRATDTKLNRDVAIKVLPEAFAADAGRMARFEREARLLASLNHPNIATVYGVEQGALIMELIEGPDLAGPVPVETAIAYARQIAAGLEAAHEKGIVHRDLKPANIKITPEGVVKLLDFGLARGTEESTSSAVSPTMSPTLSLAMTQAGMILGTAAYMSPEQARGKAVDKRTDIWAFGVVLFELLTGSMLFGGETVSDSMAAVITREPDWNTLPKDTPPHIRRLIERCLRKDPKLRLRDIGEARVALDEPEAAVETATAPRRAWLPWAVSALTFLVAGAAWLRPKPPDPVSGMSQFTIPLPPGTTWPISSAATEWVPSPDGRNLALIANDTSGKSALWVRPLTAAEAHRLDKTEDANFPFWSPDSQFIAFSAEGKLKRVAAAGGNLQTVCNVSGQSTAQGGAWSQDGTIVFAPSRSALLRVPATGGTPAPVTALEKDEISHGWPQFLPDGRHLLYFARNNDPANSAIYVQELGSAKRVRALKNPTRAMWSPPGYLLFAREATLFAQRMDSKTFQVEGDPLAVAQEVTANDSNGRSTFAVSQNGVLAYRGGAFSNSAQLTWRDRAGKLLGVIGKPGELRNLSLSPDEKSAALLGVSDQSTSVMNLATGVVTPMARNSMGYAAWSPDSKQLAVAQSGGGVQQVDLASGKVIPLTKEPVIPEVWSPDGSSVLCSDPDGYRLSLLSLADGGKLRTIIETPYRKQDFRFSPDGKYVVYSSGESGHVEIYAASFPSFALKRKISSGGGIFPWWARSGREIFYHANDGTLMDVEATAGSNLDAGIPKPLFKVRTFFYRFAVSADDKRFLMVEPVSQAETEKPEITLVLNWAAEMKLP